MDDYIRPLSEVEQGLDMLEAAKAAAHLVRVMRFEGNLDTNLLERALRQLLERRPLLRTRIVRTPDDERFFAPCAEWPHIRLAKRVDDEQWHNEFEHHLSTPVGVDNDPVIRLSVLVGDDRGEILLSCHHSTCDGRSLTGLCRDLIHEYQALQRGEPGDPHAIVGVMSPPLDQLVPPPLDGPRRDEMVMDRLISWAELAQSPPGFMLPNEQLDTAPRARRLLSYELGADVVERLRACARAKGTTIGGALSAAVMRAGVELGGPTADDHLGFEPTVDLRPYLREDVPIANMGMYASGAMDHFVGIRTKPFWELAREMSDSVKRIVDSPDPFCDLLAIKKIMTMLLGGAVPTMWPQFYLANLGRVDLPEATGSFRVTSIHGGTPLQGVGPSFFCSSVGLGGSIFIDVMYQRPDVTDEVAKAFSESLVDRLTIESGTLPASN